MAMGGHYGHEKPLPTVARTVKVPGVTAIANPPSFLKETATADAQPPLSYSDSPRKTTQTAGPQTGDQPTGLPTPKSAGGSSDSAGQQSEPVGFSVDNLGAHVVVAPTLSQLAGDNALPATVTPGGIALSVGSSIAVIRGTTFDIGPGATPTVQVVDGQTVSIGSGGVKLAGTAVVPQPLQGLSLAVIDGTTFTVGPGVTPTVKVIDAQTISIGPAGIGLVSASPSPVTQMGPEAPFTVATAGGVTFSGASPIAIIDGTTFTTGPGATPTTKVIGSQTISIGPGGIGFATTTIPPQGGVFSTVTAGGLTFFEGSSNAIIDGTTFSIGPGATQTTKVIGEETISLGPSGIGFATTTIPPVGGLFSTITAGEITFLQGSSIAIIDGTTFAIGPGAKATGKVINGQTLSIGPDGIGLATTIVRPLGSSTTSATPSMKPSVYGAPSQTAKSTKESFAVFDRGKGRGVVGVIVAIGVVVVLSWA
ncbi:MAG: hypothetical protein M1840_001947 [Geoglossum simile]|nr:MAG: hypothetical protein M1840_001947 [Geoglossum simile]